MNTYPDSMQSVINDFKKLPGIGEKSAERMAFFILENPADFTKTFSTDLLNLKVKTKKCKICNNLTEKEICNICADKQRDSSILCVVESNKNIFLLEKTGSYNGKYHVLNGLISPLNGITPEDIDIQGLINRIHSESIKEVIMAVKPTIEGEATTLYISKLLKDEPIIVSKIAHGIPLGADIEYIDTLTLEMAMEDRKNISE